MLSTSYLASRPGLVCLALAVAYWIYRWFNRRSHPGHMRPSPLLLSERAKCKPINYWRTWDPIFALDVIYDTYKQLKAHRLLDRNVENFQRLGNTFYIRLMLKRRVILTIEPENVKTVLATEFDAWGLGEERKQILMPLLGEGIFLEEGEAWRWSRQLLRPCFDKSRVSAVRNFEPRVQEFFSRIRESGPGCTVDLQPLFTALSMDISTEFLFGETSGMLHPECSATVSNDGSDLEDDKVKRMAKSRAFVKAFNYALSCIQRQRPDSRGFLLDLLLPNPKVQECHQVIHGT